MLGSQYVLVGLLGLIGFIDIGVALYTGLFTTTDTGLGIGCAFLALCGALNLAFAVSLFITIKEYLNE
jgi:hypothetical protein